MKIDNLTMPRKGSIVNMWNLEGKKFSGKVIQCRKNHFFIIEHGTNARAWIDLNRLNYWAYPSNEEKRNFMNTHVTRENDSQSDPLPTQNCLISVPFENEVLWLY